MSVVETPTGLPEITVRIPDNVAELLALAGDGDPVWRVELHGRPLRRRRLFRRGQTAPGHGDVVVAEGTFSCPLVPGRYTRIIERMPCLNPGTLDRVRVYMPDGREFGDEIYVPTKGSSFLEHGDSVTFTITLTLIP